MNAWRRNKISATICALTIERENIQGIMDEEQEAFDNLPEGLQASERGEKLTENVDALQDAYTAIEECIERLEEIMGN